MYTLIMIGAVIIYLLNILYPIITQTSSVGGQSIGWLCCLILSVTLYITNH